MNNTTPALLCILALLTGCDSTGHRSYANRTQDDAEPSYDFQPHRPGQVYKPQQLPQGQILTRDDGTTTYQNGHIYSNSDGSTDYQYGNTRQRSDGSTWMNNGNGWQNQRTGKMYDER